jgi:hypothetical protein
MKFDVVIGNPPYQNDSSKSQANKLWYKFIELGYDISKQYVAMITPDAWTHPESSRSKYKKIFRENQLIFANIHECAKHFPGVGSSFTWWLLENKQPDALTMLDTNTGRREIDMQTWLWIPNEITEETVTALQRTLWSNLPKIDYVGSQLPDEYHSAGQTEEYQYPFQLSTSTISWRKDPCRYQTQIKIMFPFLASHTKPILDLGTLGATHGINILFDTREEAEAAYEYYLSDDIQTALRVSKWHHGNMNPQVLKQLPRYLF